MIKVICGKIPVGDQFRLGAILEYTENGETKTFMETACVDKRQARTADQITLLLAVMLFKVHLLDYEGMKFITSKSSYIGSFMRDLPLQANRDFMFMSGNPLVSAEAMRAIFNNMRTQDIGYVVFNNADEDDIRLYEKLTEHLSNASSEEFIPLNLKSYIKKLNKEN